MDLTTYLLAGASLITGVALLATLVYANNSIRQKLNSIYASIKAAASAYKQFRNSLREEKKQRLLAEVKGTLLDATAQIEEARRVVFQKNGTKLAQLKDIEDLLSVQKDLDELSATLQKFEADKADLYFQLKGSLDQLNSILSQKKPSNNSNKGGGNNNQGNQANQGGNAKAKLKELLTQEGVTGAKVGEFYASLDQFGGKEEFAKKSDAEIKAHISKFK